MMSMKHFAPTSSEYLPAAGHDHLLPFYDLLTKVMGVGKIHRDLIQHADLEDGHRVLEVGTGTGNVAVLAKKRAPGIAVTATDPDPLALRRARKKSKAITFERAFAEDLPYADASFDRVLSSLMLHHLNAEKKTLALAEIRRVLAPGGTLSLVDLIDDGHGLAAHRTMRQASFADDVPSMLLEAGFSSAEEVGRRSSRIGTVGYWRGTAV